MNSKMQERMNEILNRKKIGFMGHIIANFPNYEESLNAALGICEGGADFIEVQFPFSDPTADGPTIESACYTAITNGFNISDGFKLVNEIADKTNTMVIIMTYANIPYKYGIEKFIKKAKESGACGVIIPDIPIENDEGLIKICRENEISVIQIATPGADAERIKNLSENSDPFLYTLARRGITGKKSDINDEAIEWFNLVRKNSKIPIAVGFGIRTNEQIKQLYDYCNIAIIGSHFVNIIKQTLDKKGDLKEALKNEMINLLK